MSEKRLVLSGVPGRMAARIAELALNDGGWSIAGALARPGSEWIGRPLGSLPGFPRCETAITEGFEGAAEVLIDFSAPAGALACARVCVERGLPLMTGTTGLSDGELAELRAASKEIPVLWASNTSLGVHVLKRVAAQVAAALGAEYDIEVVESHHRWKKDAPSGTAKTLAEAAAEARGQVFSQVARHGREGREALRQPGEIGVHALRMGDVVGEHRLYFVGVGERIEVAHAAHSRDTFAAGALRAAGFLVGKAPGWYSMDQVLFGA